MLRVLCLLWVLAAAPLGAMETPAPAARTIVLVRHGNYLPDASADPFLGPHLTELGVRQGQLAGQRLAGMGHFDALHVSPLLRARDTATAMRGNFPGQRFQVLDDLAECTPPTRVAAIMAGEKPEELEDCRQQLERVFARIFKPASGPDRQELYVAHGNVIRYLVTRAQGVDPMSWLSMSVGHASITRIRVDEAGNFKILAVGDIGHVPVELQTGASGDPDRQLPENAEVATRISRLLADTPMVDGHNDLVIRYMFCGKSCPRGHEAYDISGKVSGHTDLARWQAGGLGAQLLNAGWTEDQLDLEGTLKGLAFARELATLYPDRIAMARSAADVRRIHDEGKLAILLALENPGRLGKDRAQVQRLAAEGLRSNILAYDGPTEFADGHAGPPSNGGLSPRGRQMVEWMQQAGILVDLSHASAGTAREVLDIARAPVIFSHSSAAGLCDVSRNVPDDVLRRLPKNGGLVMVSFVPEFSRKEFADWYDAGEAFWKQLLSANGGDTEAAKAPMDAWEAAHRMPRVSVADVADHVEYIRDLAGIDHVGLGSDFDGISFTVTGLEDVSKFPALLEELIRRGWTDAELRKLMGENFLRVLEAADRSRG